MVVTAPHSRGFDGQRVLGLVDEGVPIVLERCKSQQELLLDHAVPSKIVEHDVPWRTMKYSHEYWSGATSDDRRE